MQMFRSVALQMFRPVLCQKNWMILVLCLISLVCLVVCSFGFFSCPWVDQIYCDNYFMTKIETKCCRRGMSFFCVKSQCQRHTPGRIHPEQKGMSSVRRTQIQPLRPHIRFDSSLIILLLVDVEERRRVDEISHRCVWIATRRRQVDIPWHQSLSPTFFSLQTLF